MNEEPRILVVGNLKKSLEIIRQHERKLKDEARAAWMKRNPRHARSGNSRVPYADRAAEPGRVKR